MVSKEEVPLAYLPGGVTRVRTKVVGDLALHEQQRHAAQPSAAGKAAGEPGAASAAAVQGAAAIAAVSSGNTLAQSAPGKAAGEAGSVVRHSKAQGTSGWRSEAVAGSAAAAGAAGLLPDEDGLWEPQVCLLKGTYHC